VSALAERARRDPELALLPGVHALKHALRFGAEVLEALAPDVEAVLALAQRIAPDVAGEIATLVRPLDAERFAALAPRAPAPALLAVARRPVIALDDVLRDPRPAPIVLLEDPRSLGNMGACIRVAAAADATGVLTIGEHDPWHPDVLRGAAGLHYALPVARVDEPARLQTGDRPLVALDPEGEPLDPRTLPPRAVLAFGSERRGLSDELLAAADARIRIPMREGVSSLNLATSVAAVLFVSRLQAM
jgi:RNA methyltransferase, TrmH family